MRTSTVLDHKYVEVMANVLGVASRMKTADLVLSV